MTGLEIAIVGISCRFPGAPNQHAFWRLLQEGEEAISFFSPEELMAGGVPAEVAHDPMYVKARGFLPGIELFDPEFFAFTRHEAELMDPQQRIFLECAWEALEDGGYDLTRYAGAVGVYAGSAGSQYLFHLHRSGYSAEVLRSRQAIIGNESDHLPARVAYKLNLQGPAVAVQTACSTSLVSVHMACQGLLSGDCDMALAGGASITVPQKIGYFYQEGGIESKDGHCRAFDAEASGTVSGSGVGVVLLKRLADAVEDRDQIYAVIRGSAINNDGAGKIGYTAPGIDGQVKAIRMAQLRAGVEPESISYVETHGTGTELGDPIEIAALNQVFSAGAWQSRSCAIGSVKSNLGHLDTAAGVAGLIKTALALQHGFLPPSLHFKVPNPKIDFAAGPFYVISQPLPWPSSSGKPRRAGVSSFGIGGTNAHVVMEEAPSISPAAPGRGFPILLLAAKTSGALQQIEARLLDFLRLHPGVDLFDLAFTLQIGRKHFPYRAAAVCQSASEATKRLADGTMKYGCAESQPHLAFMFPGQAAQSANMARSLYEAYPHFRKEVDECCAILALHHGLDLRTVLYPPQDGLELAEARLLETSLTQPAMFVIDYALARLWMKWGVRPAALIGHSLGDYVAACIAGVISLEDALRAVVVRGQLMQNTPAGAMLAVGLAQEKVLSLLNENLTVAAVNSSSLCVVAGATGAVEEFERTLAAQGTFTRRLKTNCAFHSSLMDGVIREFVAFIKTVRLNRPLIPCISGVSGQWLTEADATDPEYWGRQLRQTVMFAEGIKTVRQYGCHAFLEVGPGAALARLVSAEFEDDEKLKVWSSLASHAAQNELEAMHEALAGLWLNGVTIDWQKYHDKEARKRIGLPTYPFERARFWPESRQPVAISKPGDKQESLTETTDDFTLHREFPGPHQEAQDETIRILEQQISIMQQQLSCWEEILQ